MPAAFTIIIFAGLFISFLRISLHATDMLLFVVQTVRETCLQESHDQRADRQPAAPVAALRQGNFFSS
jgi:hypothetical protein